MRQPSDLRTMSVRIAGVALIALAFTSPLGAQSRQELRHHASFTAGASFGDGETALATAIALGVRVAGRAGVELELTHARKLDFVLDLCPAPRLCVIGGRLPVTGRTVSLVPHITIELLPPSPRLRVYAGAGIGAGHVRQRYFFGSPLPTSSGERVEFTRSKPTPAVSFGGGAEVDVSPRLAVGVDVRSLHLFDDPPAVERFITPAGRLSTLRIGSRLIWRF